MKDARSEVDGLGPHRNTQPVVPDNSRGVEEKARGAEGSSECDEYHSLWGHYAHRAPSLVIVTACSTERPKLTASPHNKR